MSRISRFCGVLLTSAVLVAWFAWPASAGAASNTFSGRAFAVGGQVEGISVGPLADTGNVSPSGGALHACLLSFPTDQGCALSPPAPDVTGGALQVEVLHAAVIAGGNASHADAAVGSFSLTAAGQKIGGDVLFSQARAECSSGTASISGSSELAALTLNGQTIMVAGQVNETVPILGVGSIVINEQSSSLSASHGDITVNALHVMLKDPVTGKVTDLTIASAHADITCINPPPPPPPPPPPNPPPFCPNQDFVTGGGWIPLGSSKGTFGVGGGLKDGFWGHLVYQDHGTGLRVKGTGVTGYAVTGPTSRHIDGNAELNGAPGYTYGVDVNDKGSPGRGADTFSLTVSKNGAPAYTAGGTLGGGNLTLHCK